MIKNREIAGSNPLSSVGVPFFGTKYPSGDFAELVISYQSHGGDITRRKACIYAVGSLNVGYSISTVAGGLLVQS